jgi:hypothetical protein
MEQNITSPKTLKLSQNYGYEYLTSIYWMKDVQVTASSEKTLYYLPAKAVLSACMAIDGYVNMVGCKVDPRWIPMDEEKTSIKERLLRIYTKLNLPLALDQGIWADVLALYDLREKLSHFDLAGIYGMPETDTPEIFKEIEQRYPIRLTHSIAEEAIQLLLDISE